MANEVNYICARKASMNEDLASAVVGTVTGGDVIDIATASAALTGDVCIVQAIGTGFWIKTGVSGVSAAANTAANWFIPAGGVFTFEVNADTTHFDTAADA